MNFASLLGGGGGGKTQSSAASTSGVNVSYGADPAAISPWLWGSAAVAVVLIVLVWLSRKGNS